MTDAERQILVNQIAIMSGVKLQIRNFYGESRAGPEIARLADAIAKTVMVLQKESKHA